VAEQIIHRAGLRGRREPRILEVALDQAATLQRSAYACGDLLDQLLQVARLASRRDISFRKRLTSMSSMTSACPSHLRSRLL
jgi:hypothetical protein